MRAVLSSPIRPVVTSPVRSLFGIERRNPILALLAKGTDGFWFNARNLYQDQLLTVTDDAGENIGEAFERSKWSGRTTLAQERAFQAELRVGATTGADTGTGVSSDDGTTITLNGPDASNRGRRSYALTGLVVGQTYVVDGTLALTSGGVSKLVGSGVGNNSNFSANQSASGPLSFIFAAAATSRTLTLQSGASGGLGSITGLTIKAAPGNHGVQATSAAQPKLQFDGTKPYEQYDAADDNLLTPFVLAQSGFLLLECQPDSDPASQIMMGAAGATGADRLWVGFATGVAACRKGTAAAISAGGSRVGVRGTVGVRWSATTLDLLVDGVVVATQANVEVVTTTIPLRKGAYNSNGTASTWFGGRIYEAIGEIGYVPTDAEILVSHNAMMAA